MVLQISLSYTFLHHVVLSVGLFIYLPCIALQLSFSYFMMQFKFYLFVYLSVQCSLGPPVENSESLNRSKNNTHWNENI